MAPLCNLPAVLSLVVLLTVVALSSSTQYFSVEPQDTETIQGNRVVFSCRVINRPAGAQLYWQIPGIENRFIGPEYQIPPGYDDQYEITGTPALNDYNFVIKSASDTDEGVYKCFLFQSSRGDTPSPTQIASSRDAQLTVATLDPSGVPDCWASPRRVVHVGDAVRLNCASSEADLDLQWTRNSTTLPSVMDTTLSIPTLITTNLTVDTTMDGERFTCSSPTTSNRQCDVVLSVLSPPVVMISPVGEIKVGRDGRYRCIATGNPSVFSYSWKYNDVVIGYQYDRRFNLAIMEENGAVLFLPDMQRDDDAALLECTAINDNGEGSSTLAVRVANNNTTSIVAWCLCAFVVAIILVLLVAFFYWRSQQHRKMEKLSQARERNKRGELDAEADGHVNPTFTGFSPLEVDSVGYGPDVQPYISSQTRPSTRDYDHGGPKPIPRQNSTGKSANGSDSDPDFISKDMENDEEEDMTQTYTYQVNPKFDEYRASYDVSNGVDDDDHMDGDNLKKSMNNLDLEKELVGELSMFSQSGYDHNFDNDAEPIVVSTEL